MGINTAAIKQLPNRHQRNVDCDLREYRPVFCPGENYANMVNSEELLIGIVAVFSDLKLSILNNRGVLIAEDIATFDLYDSNGTDARIAYQIVNFPDLNPGKVRVVIYEEVQNLVYYASNLHEVITSRRILEQETAYLEYRHSSNIYNFGYEELTDFTIKERVHINAVSEDHVFNASEYEEVTTGLSYNPRFDIDLSIGIETENYDREAHIAFATFLAHNNKKINNLEYIVANGEKYTGDRDPNSYLWNGNIKLKQQKFSTINKQ